MNSWVRTINSEYLKIQESIGMWLFTCFGLNVLLIVPSSMLAGKPVYITMIPPIIMGVILFLFLIQREVLEKRQNQIQKYYYHISENMKIKVSDKMHFPETKTQKEFIIKKIDVNSEMVLLLDTNNNEFKELTVDDLEKKYDLIKGV